jgi:hypothetical protein
MPGRARANSMESTTHSRRERQSAAARGLMASLAILAVAACGAGMAEEPGEAGAREGAGTDVIPLVGTLSETSTGGALVRLAFDPDPLAAGPLILTLAIDPPPNDPGIVSLDVVSPEMPMHGVVRYPVQEVRPGRFTAAIVVPMAGLWEFYVNLDVGLDTAPFAVRVLSAGPDGSGPHVEADVGSRDQGHDHHHAH